jgi:hypothetical protein
MTASTDLSPFINVQPGALPVFTGTEADALPTWRGLNKTDRAVQWCKAAIAASLERAWGQRTDCGAPLTPIQSFSKSVGIGVEHCARLAKTYRFYDKLLADLQNAPLDPGSNRSLPKLLADDRLSFKHFLIAANFDADRAVKALLEARDNGLSAGTMLKFVTGRKKKLRLLLDADGEPATHKTYDDDPDITLQLATPDETAAIRSARAERERCAVRLAFDAHQRRAFDSHVIALGLAYGTTEISDTVATAVARAFDALKPESAA